MDWDKDKDEEAMKSYYNMSYTFKSNNSSLIIFKLFRPYKYL